MSVWVEIPIWIRYRAENWSRSTWACELKCSFRLHFRNGNSHAPRERVSWNVRTWKTPLTQEGHAPRERVSWNPYYPPQDREGEVTLHVSVWVEIFKSRVSVFVWMLSRSTWACELKCHTRTCVICHIMSRSTWACELKFLWHLRCSLNVWSRSTWACELKYITY